LKQDAGEVTVTNNEAESRFEVGSDGPSAVLEYELSGNELFLTHTEVAPELEGQGLGAKLARAALEFARERGLGVVPSCTFVAAYIERHPEYRPLVCGE
jgi:predicted GNAT family acetyltransferase